MRLQDLPQESRLREFGQEVWDFIVGQLGATIDQPHGESEYHLVRNGNNNLFLTFRFVGEKARAFRPNSLVLYAPWDDSFDAIPGIRKGQVTWRNGPSAELGAHPEEAEVVRDFIRLACNRVHG
jgi:hypothetical protein